jgi:hypothetical protein
VLRAYDPERDRLVAVKVFRLDLPPERVHQLVADFERLIATGLTHAAIATPLATGIEGTVPYLAQEYAAADSLDVVMRNSGPAPPADALRIAVHLAGALDFAAVVHVGHGALHPRDVLISQNETRLTGLGIARALERVGVAAPVRRPYSAPERIDGATWGPRADVFSLALLLCELLWGRRISAIGAEAADALPPLPGGDRDALRTVFARALAADPADRFTTALDFADRLGRAFPGIRLAPVAPSPRSGRSTRLREESRLPLDLPESAPPPPDRLIELAAPVVATAPVELEQPLAPSLDCDIEPEAAVGVDAERGVEPESDLRAVVASRYDEVEPVPVVALSAPAAVATAPGVQPLSGGLGGLHAVAASFDSAVERSRSAIWPLALALVVGLAVGFAVGYGVGARVPSGAATSAVAPSPQAGERTEGAVPDTAERQAPAPPPTPSSEVAMTPTQAPTPAQPPAPAVGDSAAVGRLLVRSTPAGARVFVDGRDSGPTPVAVRDLAYGPHRVRIVLDGYDAIEQSVVFAAARPAQSMSVTLLREADPRTRATAVVSTGALTIETRPAGAKAFVDGKLVGTTPLQIPEVATGLHEVRIERDGYLPWTSSVRVVAGELHRVAASLEK